MASIRDLKQRIKSVENTKQITKAMNLVSSAKFGRAKLKLEQTRPYFAEYSLVMDSLKNSSANINHKYTNKRPIKNSLVIVISGDRGLCGGYNSNICKKAQSIIEKKRKSENPLNTINVEIVSIGLKARDYFKRRNFTLAKSYRGISENPYFDDAKRIRTFILEKFDQNEYDEIVLVYSKFNSTISHAPTVVQLLPLVESEKVDKKDNGTQKIETINFEPNEESILEMIVPSYIDTMIFGALNESATCELASRMTAMDSATDNANTMIDDYSLLYNRIRQSAITQEITEIVSGSLAIT